MTEQAIQRRAPFGDNPRVGERGAGTHQRILEAALSVFGERGYHHARVEHITEAAECSRPSFYQYFSSKEDVFAHLAGRLGRKMVALANELEGLSPEQAGVDVLREWVHRFGLIHARYRPVFESFNAAVRGNAALRTGSTDVAKGFREALTHEAGLLGDDSVVTTVATSITTIITGAHRHRTNLEASIDEDRFDESLALLLHRALYGPVPGVNLVRRGPRKRPVTGAPPAPVDPQVPSTPEGRTLRPQGLKTRQKILDASAVVLARKGYHETRVDDIVDEAEVSHGSFYRYFDSKDGIFGVLAAEATVPLLELLGDFPEPATDDVRGWVDRWFENYREQGAIISAWQEIEHSDEGAEALSRAVSQTVLSALESPLSRRDFGDVEVDALALLAMIERLPYSAFTLGQPAEAQARDALEVFISRGLFGRAR